MLKVKVVWMLQLCHNIIISKNLEFHQKFHDLHLILISLLEAWRCDENLLNQYLLKRKERLNHPGWLPRKPVLQYLISTLNFNYLESISNYS